jgi:hypothetical protein
MTRIRFVGLADASQPGKCRTPHEIAAQIRNPHAAPTQERPPQPPCQLPLFLLDCRPALESPMTPFFVQIKCELGKSYQVANQLAEAEIASEIYSTAGDFDLLVKFYVDSGTDIGHFVNEKVQCISGIKDTHTIITFKAFQF